jgi:hypothetical protein
MTLRRVHTSAITQPHQQQPQQKQRQQQHRQQPPPPPTLPPPKQHRQNRDSCTQKSTSVLQGACVKKCGPAPKEFLPMGFSQIHEHLGDQHQKYQQKQQQPPNNKPDHQHHHNSKTNNTNPNHHQHHHNHNQHPNRHTDHHRKTTTDRPEQNPRLMRGPFPSEKE